MMNTNDQNDARRGASPRARRGARLLPAALLLLAPLMGACEGDNLFDGGAEDYVPIASVSAPAFASAGETFSVRVDGYAARGVAQLAISVDGIISKDTVITVTEKTSVSELVPLTVPVALDGTSLRVRAHVIDQAGQFSPTAEAIVEAYGPPYVQIVSAPVTVQPGQVVDIEVAATAVERVDQIALKLSGAVSKDTTVTVTPAAQSVRQTIRLQVPTVVEDTILTVTATARDQAGNRGSAEADVPFVVGPPAVSLTAPANVQAGGMLNLEVRAQALRKVSEVRVELRGGVVKDTIIKLNPQQANVTEYVALKLPGNITNPTIQVRALAMDRSGLLGATAVQTVAVPLSTPMTITLLNPPASVTAGHFLDLRVTANGPRPYKEIIVRWRGFSASVFDSLGVKPDTTVTLATPRSPATEDVRVAAPCLTTDGSFIVNVTARDQAEQLSPITTTVVTVSGNPACEQPDEDEDEDSTSASMPGIALAPALSAAPAAAAEAGSAPAFLAGRGFAVRSAGRKRSARR
jgi:hypothetical protein